jgi:hypothetical protein
MNAAWIEQTEAFLKQKLDYVAKRISRLGELMELPMGTQAAATLWRERVGFYLAFFEKLSAQLSASVQIAGSRNCGQRN